MDGKLQCIIQLWQTDQKNHSPVPGVHLKVEQDLQVVKDSIFDIVRFIDDDNWCLPLIQGKAVDLLLDDMKVFGLPVGWLCAQGCGEIPPGLPGKNQRLRSSYRRSGTRENNSGPFLVCRTEPFPV